MRSQALLLFPKFISAPCAWITFSLAKLYKSFKRQPLQRQGFQWTPGQECVTLFLRLLLL